MISDQKDQLVFSTRSGKSAFPPALSKQKIVSLSLAREPCTLSLLHHLYDEMERNVSINIPNCFLDRAWIVHWFESIGCAHTAYAYIFKDREKIIGFCCCTESYAYRRKLFKRNIRFLNEYPLGDSNAVIEYNGIICPKEYKQSAWQAFALWHAQHRNAFHELEFSLLLEDDAIAAQTSFVLYDFFVHEKTLFDCPYAILIAESELKDVSANTSQDESWALSERRNISSRRRRQLRKSQALLEARYGAIQLTIANSVEQALIYFQQLEFLHTESWKKRGLPGAFENIKWVALQKRLIAYKGGRYTQLICIKAGDHVVGYLYNLVSGNAIFNVQSGFNYCNGRVPGDAHSRLAETDNKIKPGFTCHYLAMQENTKMNMHEYHFLAGGEPYKKSLSAKSEKLYSLTIRSRRIFWLEDTLVSLVRYLRSCVKNKNCS